MTERRITVSAASVAVVLNAVLFVIDGWSGDVFWVLDRSAGAVTTMLMTAAVVLGIVRAARPDVMPLLIDRVHVNVALLTIVFGAVHILSTILGRQTSLGPVDALVPFIAPYRGAWVGIGVLSLYVYAAVLVTSWPLRRLTRPWWSWLHRAIYVAWALAIVHAVGAGTDSRTAPYTVIEVLAVIAVLGTVIVTRRRRRVVGPPPSKRVV